MLLTIQETGLQHDTVESGGLEGGRPSTSMLRRSTETPVCTTVEGRRFRGEDLSITYMYTYLIFYSFPLKRIPNYIRFIPHQPWRGRGVFKLIYEAAVSRALLSVPHAEKTPCRESEDAGTDPLHDDMRVVLGGGSVSARI